MAYRTPTREDDEILLRMLEGRALGFTGEEIGAKLGLPGRAVRTMTNRVYVEMETEHAHT